MFSDVRADAGREGRMWVRALRFRVPQSRPDGHVIVDWCGSCSRNAFECRWQPPTTRTTTTTIALHLDSSHLIYAIVLHFISTNMPPRRVKRATARKPADVKDATARPARKAVKTRRNKGGESEEDRDKGRLNGMLDMPTDIIFEVRNMQSSGYPTKL